MMCAFFIMIGIFWTYASNKPNQFLSVINTTQEYEGVIVSEVDMRDTRQQFQFLPDHHQQRLLITIYTFGGREVSYGDRLRVRDKVELPENFSDFDYRAYLEKENVYAVMRSPQIQVIGGGGGNWFVRKSLALRDFLTDRLKPVIKEPELGLLRGILLGQKRALPDSIYDQFVRTGTSHIVAVSGYNVTIIIGTFLYLARYVGRRASIYIALSGIIVYTLMVGPSPSVLRASFMGALLAVSMAAGRLYRPASALCLAAAIMVAVNPKILLHDVGFQLSFLATLGIMLFVPLLQSFRAFAIIPKFLAALIAPTVSATIATLPIILLQFKTLSLVSLPANILVLPAVPIAMLFGTLALLPIIGHGLGFIAQQLLWYMLWMVSIASNFPHSQLDITITFWEFCALSFIVISLYFIFQRRKRALETSVDFMVQ